MNDDEQYLEALGYYTRGRDENYPLDPGLIIGEGGDEYRAEFDRFLARVRRDAANEAWEKCAVMAAHHGAHDGGRTRWLSSINPYTTTEKENA